MKIISQISSFFRINFCATLVVNFKTQKFWDAVKLPILIYNKCVLKRCGKINISGNIRRGILKIGMDDTIKDCKNNTSILDNYGTIIIHGQTIFRTGTHIRVDSKGVLSIGDDVRIGANNLIICTNCISFNNNIDISWDCQFIDSDMHYVKNLETGIVKDKSKPVIIGNHVWIGNHCLINKGTSLAAGIVVASNSMVNKAFDTANIIIGGSPAKQLAINMRRIMDRQEEAYWNEYYKH